MSNKLKLSLFQICFLAVNGKNYIRYSSMLHMYTTTYFKKVGEKFFSSAVSSGLHFFSVELVLVVLASNK